MCLCVNTRGGYARPTRAAQCRGNRPPRRCGSTGWGASPCRVRGNAWVSQLQLSPGPTVARRLPGGPTLSDRGRGPNRSSAAAAGGLPASPWGPLRQLKRAQVAQAGDRQWQPAARAAPPHRLSSRKSYALAAGSAIAAARQHRSAARPRRLESAMAMALGEARGPARSSNAAFCGAPGLTVVKTALQRDTACTPRR